MVKTAPSFASVLHRLALGEAIEGSELLLLPGVADLETEYPILDSLDYRADDLPELWLHTAVLAAPVSTASALFAHDIARIIMLGWPFPNYLPAIARSAAWQLGADADFALRLEEIERCPI